jgi:hypothetical protein
MQDTFTKADEQYDDTLEQIRLVFIEEHEAGRTPALEAFVARYPKYARELTDFILDHLRTKNAVARMVVAESPSPYAVAAVNRALASLGIASQSSTATEHSFSAQPLNEVRNARNWSLGELARHLLLPNNVALKLERGQIISWTNRLREKVAEVLAVSQEQAEAILHTTAGNFRNPAAAFSAEGDPDIATVNERRQERFDFTDLLSKEQLTPEQSAFWNAE